MVGVMEEPQRVESRQELGVQAGIKDTERINEDNIIFSFVMNVGLCKFVWYMVVIVMVYLTASK